jgi:hypothetical protein
MQFSRYTQCRWAHMLHWHLHKYIIEKGIQKATPDCFSRVEFPAIRKWQSHRCYMSILQTQFNLTDGSKVAQDHQMAECDKQLQQWYKFEGKDVCGTCANALSANKTVLTATWYQTSYYTITYGTPCVSVTARANFLETIAINYLPSLWKTGNRK